MNYGGRWLINKIEITSFLGVGTDGINVDVGYPVTVLEGPSGAGKSTIVSAIEWALFGLVANSSDYSVLGAGGNNIAPHRAFIHSGIEACIADVGRIGETYWNLAVRAGIVTTI